MKKISFVHTPETHSTPHPEDNSTLFWATQLPPPQRHQAMPSSAMPPHCSARPSAAFNGTTTRAPAPAHHKVIALWRNHTVLILSEIQSAPHVRHRYNSHQKAHITF